MNWTTWWLFATMELVLCLTPGPAVLYVISSALRCGGRRSLASNAGILSANTIYYAVSATGVGALLSASYPLFFAVRWIGAAYLIYLGARELLARRSALAVTEDGRSDERPWRLYRGGLILQMSNPKAILFFTALLPQFVHPGAGIASQVVILGLTSVVIEFSVLFAYGTAAGSASAWARHPRYAAWTSRVAGSLLVGAGAGLAALRRA